MRERHEAEPVRHISHELPIAVQPNSACRLRAGNRQIAHEHLRQCEKSAGDPDVDLVTGVIQTNIVFALAVKAVFLALAFTGYTSLWLAILADTGATLVVIANALRLLRSPSS